MKSQPSSDLLGPGQQWTVVPATGWAVAEAGSCNFRDTGQDGDFCRRPAVLEKVYDEKFSRVELLCEQHMGSHRWIDEGVVMQWRANPPWTYREPTKVPYKSLRKKVNNA